MSEKSDRVDAIIVEHLGVSPEQVTPDARIEEDLGGDSLDVVELVMALEDDFSIAVSDDEAEKLETVSDYHDVVERLTAAKAA